MDVDQKKITANQHVGLKWLNILIAILKTLAGAAWLWHRKK